VTGAREMLFDPSESAIRAGSGELRHNRLINNSSRVRVPGAIRS
jgi:hypothetical protein